MSLEVYQHDYSICIVRKHAKLIKVKIGTYADLLTNHSDNVVINDRMKGCKPNVERGSKAVSVSDLVKRTLLQVGIKPRSKLLNVSISVKVLKQQTIEELRDTCPVIRKHEQVT